MKVSKKGYKKNSKDKNEPALVIPSNKITMKEDNGEPLKKGAILGTDNTGYSQMMYPGLDYSFPGSYVYELPMAKNGMSAPGPSKVIGGKLEISYDKDRNIYLRSLDSDSWTKIEGDRAKEFRTKFAEHMPGYFDPAGSIKQIAKKASKELAAKQQIVADKPKYQEVPQETESAQEVVQAPQSPLQQIAAGVPPMLAKSAAQPSFGDKVLSEIGNPEKIRQTKLQSKYQTSPDYHVTPYSSVNQANKEYEKTIDYKLRYKNLNEYSTDDIPKIQEKLYNEGYLQKPEQLDISTFKSKDQVIELQKKLAKFGLMDMLGKGGPNKDGITGTLTKETKDAVKRFNELNKTYKPGELDDMTKQAIKDFKNSTDSKNAMGLPIVNPKELYDPETGEPYTDKTYEAMSVFENSLKSKGYFLGDEGYDISESAAANPKISFNFKLNPEPTTAFGMCAAYVNGTVCEDDVVGDEARDELGFKGSAWHISENLQNKGGQLVFAGLPDRSSVNLNGKNEITGYLKSQLTSPETTAQLKSIVGDGNLWGKNTKVRPGDVVNIFFEGSGYTEEAYNQTKSLNNKFFTTHVGIVKADDAGNLYVEHNIHGKIEKDKIQDFIDGKVKGNGKNRVSLISGITRPNYVDGVDKDAKIPVTGVSYYQTEEGKFNPRGIFANPGDYLGQTISGENTHKYLTTIEKNKDKLLKDIPISDTEFGKLMRVARVIPTLETYAGQNAEEEKTLGYKITKGLKDIVSEKSTGFTKLKDASNLGEDLRQNLYQNDDSQLTDPVKAAIPTFYLLSKNYLYLKEVANRNNIDITSDELAKLAGLSYNQSIGKIAGELVDKGSYQKYYDYRVKTATDPGGQFKYRKVMDLYDKQTMKEGGITAPGRFRNPEGNWLTKYQTRGEVRTSVDPETGVATNINITDEPPFQWTPLEDQYGIKPSAQKRTDYVPYKDVSGAPYESQDPYAHNYNTVDVPKNLSELPSYRMYTYGKNQVYSPFSGHISRAKPNAKPINEYGDIDSKDLEDQQLYDQHTYRNFDPKTGYNYELNQENLQPFQSIPMEGDKGFNLRRFVLNPYEGAPQTEDLYIRKDKDGMQLWDGEEKVVKDKENFIPKSYSREETMDNVFKDLYAQNLYKFKGDRDAAYNATSEFMTERVEPQYRGKYYEYINNPNVSERDKLNINLVGSHMTVNPEQTEDYVRQTIADKLAEEHPEYLTNEDLDFDKAIKSDPRYREKLNEYNDVLQDWYVTNKNMSPEEAKALVEKDLYKNVPKRKTIYATFKKGGWLDKYQGDEGSSQVERRDPNQPFFPSSTEASTYESQYSLPEVTVTPNWTEAELERNRLRDDYIAKDKKVWRHWYDKLGQDKDNVTKRANQFAYNKLAKQYLKGDKENLTPEQREFIEKSEYANTLQPSVGSRFAEGLQRVFDPRIPNSKRVSLETLGNLVAPFEYPGNLVRGAVQGEFTDALKGQTPSPYFVSSDLAGTSPNEAALSSSFLTLGTDPLFLTGDDVFRGIGQGAKAIARTDAAQNAAKFLTTKTPLQHTYKLNPQAKGSLFKPWDNSMGYRVVNQEGYDDALKNFLVRPNPKGDNSVFSRPTGFPSFAKGKPSKNFLKTDNTPHYIMETDVPLYARGEVNPVTGMPIKSSHGAARPIDPITGETLTSMPLEDINTIYKAQPNWLKGYESVWQSPKNIQGLGNLTLGENIAKSGAFNRGVYELPDYPGYLLKYEDTDVVKNTALHNIDDLNFADLQRNVNSPNVGKVIKHFKKQTHPTEPMYAGRDMEGYIMRRMEGEPLATLELDKLKNIPESAFVQYAKDYDELIQQKLAMDNVGHNILYDPQDKVFRFIDLSPEANPDMSNFWSTNIIGNINSKMPRTEQVKAIKNAVLGQVDNNVNINIEKAMKHLPKDADLDYADKVRTQMELLGQAKKNRVKRELENAGYKKYGGRLNKYQDGSQVEPSGKWAGKEMAEDLKRIWNLKDPSFTRPSNYGEYTPKFGWSRGSMTPEERAYEQEYLRQKYFPMPGSQEDFYGLQVINDLNNLLFGKQKKNGGIKSSGEGYYDYINGYSGIFAKGGLSSKKSSWLNKYK